MKGTDCSKTHITLVVTFIILIGYLDFAVGLQFNLFPVYLLLLSVIAWQEGLAVTMAVSLLADGIILVKGMVIGNPGSAAVYQYWDLAVKLVLLLLFTYGIWRIRRLMREKDAVNLALRQAISEIGELWEMIPICAWCHSVRNDQGFYQKIEVYLERVTGAQLTHGMCPACKEKYYGDLEK